MILEFKNINFLGDHIFLENAKYEICIRYDDKRTFYFIDYFKVDKDIIYDSNCGIIVNAQKSSALKDYLCRCWHEKKPIIHWSNYTYREIHDQWISACLKCQCPIDGGLSLPPVLNVEIDGNCFNSYHEFWLHLGEAFIGPMGYVGRDTYGVNEGLNSLFLCGVERINVHVKNLTVFKQKLLIVAKDHLDISNGYKKEALE